MSSSSLRLRASHSVSRVLHRYADWRIGATEPEKHCYKTSDSILLTFDDYGSKEEVEEILSILKEHSIKAMFFLQGSWAEKQPELVARIAAAGHVIGNHTYSHTSLLSLDDHAATEEIVQGVQSKWLRAPQGRYDKRIRRLALQLGYQMCYWTIDSRDWTGASVGTMQHTIMSELQPGAVVLCHIHGANTRELLGSIIPEVTAQGFTFTSFDESW